uniref:Bifunctional inhibitor/plant lipid transfer protein/seed storage helical domain-containing protein n=1 Tax=Leersia perrieri TaxID=77586 RepID=A0A0D9W023_9ORYZ
MASLAAAMAVLAVVVVSPARGQVATSCTASLITTFTPCLNFVTGSTNGGGSPTQQCCGSLAEMVKTGTDCACLILTGNVPFGLPINRTLAISLTRLCNSMSVPLQCRDTAAQIPPPAPSPPESSVQPNSAVDPTAMSPSPPIIQGQRPLLLPSLAWRRAHVSMASVSVVILIAASILA